MGVVVQKQVHPKWASHTGQHIVLVTDISILMIQASYSTLAPCRWPWALLVSPKVIVLEASPGTHNAMWRNSLKFSLSYTCLITVCNYLSLLWLPIYTRHAPSITWPVMPHHTSSCTSCNSPSQSQCEMIFHRASRFFLMRSGCRGYNFFLACLSLKSNQLRLLFLLFFCLEAFQYLLFWQKNQYPSLKYHWHCKVVWSRRYW